MFVDNNSNNDIMKFMLELKMFCDEIYTWGQSVFRSWNVILSQNKTVGSEI